MQVEGEVLAKLDADLLTVLGGERYALDTPLPVVISASVEDMPGVIQLIASLDGAVRYRLPSVGAVSAWLTLRAVREIMVDKRVKELELTHTDRIAGRQA